MTDQYPTAIPCGCRIREGSLNRPVVVFCENHRAETGFSCVEPITMVREDKVIARNQRYEDLQKECTEMRTLSGHIDSDNKLVAFIYTLIRNTVPPGEIESIMTSVNGKSFQFTNGWLASYALDIARRLE